MNTITRTGWQYVNGASLFAAEIKLNTCCVAMVKLWGESCRAVDDSGAPDWPKSTLAILVLPLVEWTGCRVSVQAIVARQNWSAWALRQLESLLLQRHKGPLCVSGGPIRITVFIRYIRILMWLPCPRMAFYYVILEKRGYNAKIHCGTLLSLIYSWYYLIATW